MDGEWFGWGMSNRLVTSLLLLQSLIFSVFQHNDIFRSIGFAIGTITSSLVILIPVSAVLAFIPWFMLLKIQEKRHSYGNFWVFSMALVCLFLALGQNHLENYNK